MRLLKFWNRRHNLKIVKGERKNFTIGVLYILTRVLVLCTQNSIQSMLFQCFFCEKLKKEDKSRKLRQNLAKRGFLTLHPNAGGCFSPRKNIMSFLRPAIVAEWSKLPCFKFKYRQTLRFQVQILLRAGPLRAWMFK